MELREKIAESLYNQWLGTGLELWREPAFEEAAPILRKVFLNKADAVMDLLTVEGIVDLAD